MSLLQIDPPMGGALAREFIVRAERVGRLPKPWVWAIYEGSRPDALHRSSRSYRSADDAWTVGNKMLVLLGRHGGRRSQAPLLMETNSSAKVSDEVIA